MAKALTPSADAPAAASPRFLAAACEKAQAAAESFGGCSPSELARTLERSIAHRFPHGGSESAIRGYLESLHIEDLALACACAEGRDAAWDHFVRAFRPELYAAARAICRADDAAARDLADSLYAELFGVRGASTERRSLLLYYHGRSKLSTWLRSVLAQRRVDHVRAARRTESLDDQPSGEEMEAHALKGRSAGAAPDPDRARLLALLQAALTSALAALPAGDRLRLAYYYLQDLTLAQIGRLTREHEATVSRHLQRTRRALRKSVEHSLREEKRLSDAQIRLCFDYAVEEWPFDLSRALGNEQAGS